ncbi:MAG: folate-binding protein YgfZ [Alphaproteobacteria bacterium]|nr:folate-binding protein YgfZ [Alphaproteobacteria bacterium]
MSGPACTQLEQRSFLALEGPERRDFLQGLVSCDVMKASPSCALYGAMLTPQGKFLYDFFLIDAGDSFLLEVEAGRAAEMLKKLTLYKLRSQVSLRLAPEWMAAAAFGQGALTCLGLPEEAGAALTFGGGLAYADPRLADAGARLALPAESGLTLLEAAGFAIHPFDAWDRHRLALALPDGSRDLVPDKAILLEAGFDELNGVDWKKGCYLGQELTARTKYRGLVRKRLLAVRYEGAAPPPGTEISQGEAEAGEMRSGIDGLGLAKIRLEALTRPEPLMAGGKTLTPEVCAWMVLPKAEDTV